MTTNDFNTLTDMLRGSDLEAKVGTLDQGRVPSAVVVGTHNEIDLTRDPSGNFYGTMEDNDTSRTHGFCFKDWTALIKFLKELV